MAAYWFLYVTSTAEIYGPPYKGNVDEWTNVPEGCSVLGPIDESDVTVTDAYNNPSHYLVQNEKLVLQPYFTLASTASNGTETIIAMLNNPPATTPTQVTFTVLGQTYTEALTNGQATLALTLHPAIVGQQINIEVSAAGCVSGTLNIGGSSSSIPMKVVTTTTPNTISPVYRSDGESYYAGVIPAETLFADIGTANSLVTHFSFDKVPATLRLMNSLITWAKNPVYTPFSPSAQDNADISTITLTVDELNGLSDIEANLMPSLYTTLANACPSGGSKQLQYARYLADSQTSYNSFSDYVRDMQTLGWE
jgi:hypothetical protein